MVALHLQSRYMHALYLAVLPHFWKRLLGWRPLATRMVALHLQSRYMHMLDFAVLPHLAKGLFCQHG